MAAGFCLQNKSWLVALCISCSVVIGDCAYYNKFSSCEGCAGESDKESPDGVRELKELLSKEF